MRIQAFGWVLVTALGLGVLAGCSDRNPTDLEVARAPVNPVVFDEELTSDVYYQPFAGTVTDAVVEDNEFAYQGSADAGDQSLKFTVPAVGSALGAYAGGVLTAAQSRDFADYNAFEFYARAAAPLVLNTAGFGNDNTGTSRFGAEAGTPPVALTTEWQRFVIPIPNPAKLIAERGLFTFAEGADDLPEGVDIWVDEIRFTNEDDLVLIRSNMPRAPGDYFIGSNVIIPSMQSIFQLDGAFVIVNHQPGYLDFSSSDPSVVIVTPRGDLRVVGTGSTVLSAKLQDLDVSGAVGVTGYAPPSDLPERPNLPASQVISMFSDAYDDVPVTSWQSDWQGDGQTTVVSDYALQGHPMKLYSAFNFVGVLFEDVPIDASEMTHFHMDVYAPAGTSFIVKVVSFPESLAGGGAETQGLTLNETTTPQFVPGGWSCLDIPLADFTITSPDWDWAEVGQLVFESSSAQLILFDNVFWHR